MDLSRVSQGQLIAGGGGILLFISLFLNWAVGQNAWNFSFVDIWMLLISVAAVVYGLAPGFGADLSLPPQSGLLVAGLGMAAFGWAFGFETEVSGDLGVWLAIVGSLGIAFGGFEASHSPVRAAPPRRAAPPPPPPSPSEPPTP